MQFCKSNGRGIHITDNSEYQLHIRQALILFQVR